ncbi:MAG TPA: MauE/DoxX family redox-associated membrane protein, partial [Micromonosporaceae bacterium]|nr:MauE/DoxX family redox-associated membrane protein [Micromonosporaceae bacterium]
MNDVILAALSVAACVYGTSAATKLARRAATRSFRAGLRATRLLPERAVRPVATLLITAEALVSVGAIAAITGRAVAVPQAAVLAVAVLACGSVLTGVLLGGVILVVRRGTRAPCRCFGAATDAPLGVVHIARNAALAAALTAGFAGGVLSGPGPAPGIADGSVAAITGL